jgi:hypothetical protein
MHWHFLRRFHAKPDLVAADFYDDNRNIIVDDDTLVLFP